MNESSSSAVIPSLCHSHTVTVVCDELLGGLPSQQGSPLWADTPQSADSNALMSVSRLPSFPPHPDCSRPPTRSSSLSIRVLPRVLFHYAFDLCTKQRQWMAALLGFLFFSVSSVMYVMPDRFHVVERRSCGYPETTRDHHLFWWKWSLRLFQTHIKKHSLSTLYMLYSQVAPCALMNLNNQWNSNNCASFWNDPSSTFVVSHSAKCY